ncbi:MAG: sulfatase-like hydrolase/transferase [Acidobacteria bacterium]|nr:sulfatase-like hydrolase/transferase [Acidobacteriota bacterium]
MNRRDFLYSALAATREKPPNILLICSDEHNHRVAGCYGNRLARTPNLDRIAARGVTFESAYTASPLCVPARLALTAGKHIHRIGAWNNSCRLPGDDYPSLPHALNAAGYESYLCGKQHYDARHRYGFTELGGNMNNSQMTGRGNRREAGDETVNEKAGRARFDEFRAGEDSTVISHDRKVTAGVLDFLAKRGRGDKPFFLFAGYLAPHFPLTVPERFWAPYRGRIAMPNIPAGHLESLPLNYKHLRRGFGIPVAGEDTIRRGRELYYGFTEWVDNEIGKVLAALGRSPLAENTVIVYTTDHGENMGEHGLWWKNCMYENAAHVPMIVCWPKRWSGGQRRRGACSHLDLVRTVADIGGARMPENADGHSMLGWLDDAQRPWRDLAVSQYYAHNIASGYAMIRSGDWKYVYHCAPDQRHAAERELYNLASDPGEFQNLAKGSSERPRIEKMHAMLVRELGEDPEETERRCRADYARGYSDAGRPADGKKRRNRG